jgi:signal transduction histidine kinase
MAEVLSNTKQDVVANVIAFDQETDSLAIIGSSTKQGQKLAGQNYHYSASQGITGWAARNQRPCYMNDTEWDPEKRFLPNAAFPTTRSALAVPVPIDSRQTVVLEVESPRAFTFAEEDVQLLEIVGGHLLASHERTKILEVHRRLVDMGQELAKRIIRVEQIPDMLKHIGSVYLNLLDAQVISFHYRHSVEELVTERVFVGELCCEPTPSMPFVELDSLTTSLMEHQTPVFFQEASNVEMLVTKRFHHIRLNVDPFVVREAIISCAAIPLVVAQESMGVMWINYRRSEPFDQTMQDLIQLLAPYASLAIQAGRQSMLEEQKRREGLRRILHDSLSHRLHDVMRSLERLGESNLTTKKVKEEWRIARAQVTRARQAVNNLIAGQTWLTFQSLVQDLQMHAQIIQETYEIPVIFTSCELPSTALSLIGGNELIYACDEAIGNALRHSQLTELAIYIDFDEQAVDVKICDNGIGFARSQVVQGLGLRSIEDRICSLGGATTIASAPGQGTCIRFQVPVPLPV